MIKRSAGYLAVLFFAVMIIAVVGCNNSPSSSGNSSSISGFYVTNWITSNVSNTYVPYTVTNIFGGPNQYMIIGANTGGLALDAWYFGLGNLFEVAMDPTNSPNFNGGTATNSEFWYISNISPNFYQIINLFQSPQIMDGNSSYTDAVITNLVPHVFVIYPNEGPVSIYQYWWLTNIAGGCTPITAVLDSTASITDQLMVSNIMITDFQVSPLYTTNTPVANGVTNTLNLVEFADYMNYNLTVWSNAQNGTFAAPYQAIQPVTMTNTTVPLYTNFNEETTWIFQPVPLQTNVSEMILTNPFVITNGFWIYTNAGLTK